MLLYGSGDRPAASEDPAEIKARLMKLVSKGQMEAEQEEE
jgi:hypothetical protein